MVYARYFSHLRQVQEPVSEEWQSYWAQIKIKFCPDPEFTGFLGLGTNFRRHRSYRHL